MPCCLLCLDNTLGFGGMHCLANVELTLTSIITSSSLVLPLQEVRL